MFQEHYKVIYQKANGETFERIRKTLPPTRIGEETSMGWKILDIKLYCKYKWYSLKTEHFAYLQAKRKLIENDELYWDLKEWA